jgi:hypothetical protein
LFKTIVHQYGDPFTTQLLGHGTPPKFGQQYT